MKQNWFKVATLSVALAMVGFAGANAQEAGDKAVGANIVMGMGNDFSHTGLGAKFQYNVTKPIRGEGSFTYFFAKDEISAWDLSVNAHILLSSEKVNVYPLAGISLLGYKDAGGRKYKLESGAVIQSTDGSYSHSYLGVNLGGGLDIKITDRFYLNGELKYRIGFDKEETYTFVFLGNRTKNYYDFFGNRLMISVGAAIKF